ncbi:hypothetical protein BSKO_09945 [Bryopsis sp. KO-2023]|nr:hypothetical protein BSKO_09945 [Bryopsis sp. KO-2023]
MALSAMGSHSRVFANPALGWPLRPMPVPLSLRGCRRNKLKEQHQEKQEKQLAAMQRFDGCGESHRGVRLVAEASSGASGPLDNIVPQEQPSNTPLSGSAPSFASFLQAFWKFLRPHTIRGTLLGSMAVTSRALLEHPALIDWTLLPTAMLGVLALLCGNGFIVGINQIYDVDIDEVNKPFLPIAAKDLSPGVAWFLVVALAAGGIAISAFNFGQFITSLYTFGLSLGTIYSIPPLRLKRFAIPAFLIIAVVRGFLLNFGVYYATRAALGLSFQWSPAIIFITMFVTVYATAIAITKDLADVKGDIQFKIETFATRLGVRNIAILGTGIIMMNYIGAIGLALKFPAYFNTKLMIGAHAVLAIKLLYEGGKLDSGKYTQQAIRRYYAWVWNLFYSEYVLFPFL